MAAWSLNVVLVLVLIYDEEAGRTKTRFVVAVAVLVSVGGGGESSCPSWCPSFAANSLLERDPSSLPDWISLFCGIK